jgi:hypothetical protein
MNSGLSLNDPVVVAAFKSGSAVARVTVNTAAVTAGGRRGLAQGADYGASPLEGAGS